MPCHTRQKRNVLNKFPSPCVPRCVARSMIRPKKEIKKKRKEIGKRKKKKEKKRKERASHLTNLKTVFSYTNRPDLETRIPCVHTHTPSLQNPFPTNCPLPPHHKPSPPVTYPIGKHDTQPSPSITSPESRNTTLPQSPHIPPPNRETTDTLSETPLRNDTPKCLLYRLRSLALGGFGYRKVTKEVTLDRDRRTREGDIKQREREITRAEQ